MAKSFSPTRATRLTLALALSTALPAHACWDDAAARYQLNSTLLHAIARTESGLNPQAIGRNRDGSRDIGLMQINSWWLPTLARHGIREYGILCIRTVQHPAGGGHGAVRDPNGIPAMQARCLLPLHSKNQAMPCGDYAAARHGTVCFKRPIHYSLRACCRAVRHPNVRHSIPAQTVEPRQRTTRDQPSFRS